MNVAIVGTGYVGLVTGVCLAANGHRVYCVDTQKERIDTINRGRVPFFEPGLPELLVQALQCGDFTATCDLATAVRNAEIVMIAVGTPTRDGCIDLAALKGALTSLGEILAASNSVKVIVLKSTVIPGTTDTFALQILEDASGKRAGLDFGLAMNPEFLREGTAVQDFMYPDRIIVGAFDRGSGEALKQLYASYECPILLMSPRNAELTKYASNALLATLISFSNEIAGMCENIEGADVERVMEGLHLDKRLSPTVGTSRVSPPILSYLQAGAGFGGSCLPKDVAALANFGRSLGVATPLLQAVLQVNEARAATIVRILRDELEGVENRRIVLLGLSFKSGTNDLRDSAALRIAELLLQEGAAIHALDPIVMEYGGSAVDRRINIGDDPYSTLHGADAALLVTAWPDFLEWDWSIIIQNMRTPLVLDARNALNSIDWPGATRYRRIGTASADARDVPIYG